MFRITASANTTEMIEFTTIGDFSDKPSVCHPVRADVATLEPEGSVSLHETASPQPAWAKTRRTLRNGAIFVDLRPESLLRSTISV
jgi:hypothetical protein